MSWLSTCSKCIYKWWWSWWWWGWSGWWGWWGWWCWGWWCWEWQRYKGICAKNLLFFLKSVPICNLGPPILALSLREFVKEKSNKNNEKVSFTTFLLIIISMIITIITIMINIAIIIMLKPEASVQEERWRSAQSFLQFRAASLSSGDPGSSFGKSIIFII